MIFNGPVYMNRCKIITNNYYSSDNKEEEKEKADESDDSGNGEVVDVQPVPASEVAACNPIDQNENEELSFMDCIAEKETAHILRIWLHQMMDPIPSKKPKEKLIVDEVLDILRRYKLIYPEDVALLMDVKVRDLRSAWYMLTGTRLIDVITHWRVMQAQDWLRKRIGELSAERREKKELVNLLKETARRCGWRSETVMSHVFKRYCGISALEWVVKISEKANKYH